MKTHTYVEIVTIGDEILYGQITDTNSQWMGTELNKKGFKVIRKTSIGDTKEEILTILEEAQSRADVVLITGGLGPTKDDITKNTIAEYFGVEMTFHQEVYDNIAELFKARNRELTVLNRMQADIPSNGKVLMNKVGTAPGMWFENGEKTIVSMPGVPHEMKYLMENHVLNQLQEKYHTPFIVHKMMRTMGIPESKLAEMIEDWEENLPEELSLAYLPRMGQVRLRITGVSYDETDLKDKIEKEVVKLRELLGENLYAEEDIDIELVVSDLLKEKGLSLATAESCTGGNIAKTITGIPGASAYYNGGIVSYSNEVKESQLGVTSESLKNFGAVSEQVALQMANNVREKYNSDYGVATTGIAGPSGGTKDKPVGTIWIALSTAEKTEAKLLKLYNNRKLNVTVTTNSVFKWLLEELKSGN
ncbi:competence/damage-inducible protein A [Flammeovirga aprica]|uniref:CinA-like protein n=1 Tax=Flammeovirga aprica JL-4 TaxID=694437 RepID=A0A7X9RTM5_9BACT|nr:competence/damage-inducible protein A [Flammeovirga aprica]NME67504.1 competence/damage-inducible protein A [Flammeovirga aprica JL-4]